MHRILRAGVAHQSRAHRGLDQHDIDVSQRRWMAHGLGALILGLAFGAMLIANGLAW